MGWVVAAVGVFAILGAVMDWEWFMTHRRARVLVRLFGRNGARVFYGLLGTALVVLGGLFAAGVVQPQA